MKTTTYLLLLALLMAGCHKHRIHDGVVIKKDWHDPAKGSPRHWFIVQGIKNDTIINERFSVSRSTYRKYEVGDSVHFECN